MCWGGELCQGLEETWLRTAGLPTGPALLPGCSWNETHYCAKGTEGGVACVWLFKDA